MPKKTKTEEPKEAVEQEPKAERKAPRTVVLRDVSRRLQTFNLPHEVYCKQSGTCLCTERTLVEAVVRKDGHRGVRQFTKRISSSFTLLPGAKSEPMHPSVKECPEVKSALRARPNRLRVVSN